MLHCSHDTFDCRFLDFPWLTDTRVFDLALVRTRHRQFYGPGPGTVVLQIEGLPGEDFVYEFAG